VSFPVDRKQMKWDVPRQWRGDETSEAFVFSAAGSILTLEPIRNRSIQKRDLDIRLPVIFKTEHSTITSTLALHLHTYSS